MQLNLFPQGTTIHFDPFAVPLLMLSCSALKAAAPAAAMELYRGVFYQTFAAHVRGDAAPAVVILSALHGFIESSATISPYEQRMDKGRADHFIEHLNECTRGVRWPSVASRVFLAGGHNYRRVMRAAVAAIGAQLPVTEVSGGIGMQRSQLGEFLRGLEPAFAEEMGRHEDGTTTFRRFGALAVGTDARLTYCKVGVPARIARILALFRGPGGIPTAEVEVDSIERGRPHNVRWLRIAHLQPL